MEAAKLTLFRELWPELCDSLALEVSVGNFLDYLQTKSSRIPVDPNWRHLVRQNRELLFERIRRVLVGSADGYEILLEYVKHDALRWLYDKYTDRDRELQATLNAEEKALKYGNVPLLPKFYIRRQMMQQMKSKLLTTFTTINVCGMDGTGKTSLLAACLRDPDVLQQTNYKVYWIDLHRLTESDLLERMYKLYHKLQIDDASLGDLPSEMPTSLGLMKERLLNLFVRPSYSKAIIILDNVGCNMAAAIECFAVCRMIIISQERLDLEGPVWHIPLQDAFTHAETMDVFRMALEGDITPNDHLHHIIEWCRGDLVTTILCAKLMVERRSSLLNVENGAKVWKRFKDELCKKDSRVITKRNTTIAIRLKALEPRLYEKYMDLAIFEVDVNITSNVLALLWGIDPGAVEEVMLQLCNKSFAVCEYNDKIDSYVYGVNHIYLNYLKSTNRKQRETHSRLLQAYLERYKYYHRFRDDNYIYQYIGYHLFEAGQLERFDIYRNLRFIEAKIKATGIADVLRDFNIYREYITKYDTTHESEVKAIVEFVERFGQDLERYPHTSILQSAMQLPEDNWVYKLAFREVRCSDRFGLYFKWLLPKKDRHYIHHLSMKENLEVACFRQDDPNFLLIGTANGDIQLWDKCYDRVWQGFQGHTDRIVHLRAYEKHFLSISQDGTVKLWKLDHKSRRNSFVQSLSANGGAELNSRSPACVKQKNYQHFFDVQCNVDNCVTYAADGDVLVAADYCDGRLVAGTAKGKLMLWENEVQMLEKDLRRPITGVQLSATCCYVYVAMGSDVLVYSTANFDFISKACCKEEIRALHTVQCDKRDEFIVVQEQQVLSCRIKILGQCANIERDVVMAMENGNANTCSSITDKYLVIGTNNNRIRMWDLQEKALIADFDTQYGNVICIDATTNWDDESIQILLTSFEDKSVQLWHINPLETSQQETEKIDAFASYWDANSNDFITAIVRNRKLFISENGELIEETHTDRITKITNFNTSFVYALSNGRVYLRADGATEQIMNLQQPITYLHALDDMIVAATGRGILFVYHGGVAHKLRDECRGDFQDAVRYSFTLHERLVVVSQRKICAWDDQFDSVEVLDAGQFNQFATSWQGRLCVTYENTFKVIDFDEAQVKIASSVTKKTEGVITSCCFSTDAKYLAFGTQDGDIEVFNVECLSLLATLKLHETPVYFLKFSHEGPILLSLAEQLAWWNVRLAATLLAQIPTRRSFRSRSNSAKSPGRKSAPPQLNLLAAMDLNDVVMLTKRGRGDMEYLLNAIKLHGSASHVACADNFRAFLTVDHVGNLYNLRMLEEAQLMLSPLDAPPV